MKRDEPLVARLERQAGQKEARFAHLLCGKVAATEMMPKLYDSKQPENDRIAELEKEVENLRSELDLFRQSFEEFKKQFE